MVETSDFFSLLAILVSSIALLFTIVVYKRDNRRELEAYLYKEKITRYQAILKIGRKYVFYNSLNNITKEINPTEFKESINQLYDLSDELWLLSPPFISAKVLDFATSLDHLYKTFNEKDVDKYKAVSAKNIETLTKLLQDFLDDLDVHNLNHSLRRRMKTGYSRSDMRKDMAKFDLVSNKDC